MIALLVGLVLGWYLRSSMPSAGDPAPHGRVIGLKTLRVTLVKCAGRIVPVCADTHRVLPEWAA